MTGLGEGDVIPATGPEAEGAKEPVSDDAGRKAADAVAWLDASLTELRGALTACGEAIDAGTLAPEVVSGKMNALVMEMMGGAAG